MPHATKTRGSTTHSGGSEHFDLCHFTLDSAADVCFALQIFLLTKVSDSAVKHEAEAPILEISPVSPNSEEANMVAIGQEVNVFKKKHCFKSPCAQQADYLLFLQTVPGDITISLEIFSIFCKEMQQVQNPITCNTVICSL